jgi:hypothetical protein
MVARLSRCGRGLSGPSAAGEPPPVRWLHELSKMKSPLPAIFAVLLVAQVPSCIPSFERDRRVTLERGMPESQIVELYGSPDDIIGPIVNAYHESVSIWFYHAKGVWIQSNSVWIYVVDRKYAKSAPPGDWPADSLATYHTKFLD